MKGFLMKGKIIRQWWYHYWPLGMAFCLMFYFSYHLIQGNHGVLAWFRLKDQLTQAEQQLKQEQEVYKKLEQSVHHLRPESLDRDLLEERARLVLNFVNPTEVVILKSS
jgi:cell division protein FtsB